jgi:hypothetical protein
MEIKTSKVTLSGRCGYPIEVGDIVGSVAFLHGHARVESLEPLRLVCIKTDKVLSVDQEGISEVSLVGPEIIRKLVEEKSIGCNSADLWEAYVQGYFMCMRLEDFVHLIKRGEIDPLVAIKEYSR